MPYTILLSLDTVGASILNVDLYNCTGDTLGNVSGCTITGNTLTNYTLMSGYSNILKRDFPKYVIVPDGTYYIKAVPSNLNDGGCVLSDISPIRIQMPTTPTPTPTTTPTPTPSPTPIPTSTPTNTPNPCSFDANVVYGLPATPTPTPTPTVSECSFDGTVVYGLSGTAIPTAIPTATPTSSPATATPTGVPPTLPPTTPPTLPPTTPPTLPPTTPPTLPPTNVPTNVPTPTPTVIPFQLTVFTGNSLPTACSNLVNPLLEPTILFYQGSLGVGTVVFRNNNYTNPVVDVVYCAVDSSTVYVVNGFEPPTEGSITSITSCPAATLEPTPIPQPTTFDVYEKCSLDGTKYHVDYNVSNLIQVTINGFCCFRIDSNVSSENMTANHNSSIYFSSFTNANCICD
jgi:hypothetical protein